jgi:ribonuclease P protein component
VPKNNMLSRSHRLSGEQFDFVMEKGKVVHTPFFWSRFVKQDGPLKIAVTCPQKIAKTAVKRNLYRRKVYSAVRLFRDSAIQGQQVIICIKEPVLKALPKEIVEEVKLLFVKMGLMK